MRASSSGGSESSPASPSVRAAEREAALLEERVRTMPRPALYLLVCDAAPVLVRVLRLVASRVETFSCVLLVLAAR